MRPFNPLWASAISGIESSGRYDLQGPMTKSGDRAYGKYQVMGNNIAPWTREVLGREMTPEEFLQDKDAQEAVFRGKFGSYVDKYGSPQEAASVWFSGRPMAQAGNASDILGTTVPAYVDKFNRGLGNAAGVKAINSADKGGVMPAPTDDAFLSSILARSQGQSTGQPYDLGDAMAGAGASMMALDNAKGAAVLAQLQAQSRKAGAQAQKPWDIDPKSGTFFRTRPDGTLEFMKNPNQPEAVEKPVPASAMKHVGETMEKYDYLNQSAINAADILDDLNSGKLDLGVFKNWINSGRNLAGISDEQSRAFSKYNQFIQNLVNDNLRLNKGVQTEGDAYRELKALQSNGTQYDNETAKEALQRVISKSQEAVTKRGTAILDSHKKNYGENEAFAPYGEMVQGWKNNFDSINGRLSAASKPAVAAPAAGGFKIIKGPH